MKLAHLRKEIDEVDWQLLQLLAKRLSLVEAIGEYKQENNLPVLDLGREEQLLSGRKQQGRELELRAEFIDQLFALILAESRRRQGFANGK